jgi:site-specific recombinase XerD
VLPSHEEGSPQDRPIQHPRGRDTYPGHSHRVEAVGNFDEFRFLTGLRQSEEIGLRTGQCTIKICETVVLGQDKDRPKTNEDRTVELCPRALAVLERHFALREQCVRAGKIKHDFVFFRDDGKSPLDLKYVYMRICAGATS